MCIEKKNNNVLYFLNHFFYKTRLRKVTEPLIINNIEVKYMLERNYFRLCDNVSCNMTSTIYFNYISINGTNFI